VQLKYWRKFSALLLVLQCVLSSVTISFAPAALAVDAVTKEAIENTQKTPEASYLDLPRIVLKNGSTFMVLTPDGMMTQDPSTPYGVYSNDTRTMCGYTIKIDGKPVIPIGSRTAEAYRGYFYYTTTNDYASLGKFGLRRYLVIDQSSGAVVERLTLENRFGEPLLLNLEITYDFDFKDMFEVRGQTRQKRGIVSKTVKTGAESTGTTASVDATYTGLDKQVLTSGISFKGLKPVSVSGERCNFKVALAPDEMKTIEIAYGGQSKSNFELASKAADLEMTNWQKSNVSIKSDNASFDQIFKQAVEDLYILKITTPKGPGYAAGLPWYAVAFGRDQVITALQTLDFAPDVAREVVTLLAKYQGTKDDKFTEETPGKIMHELRTGEMARCKEIPFIPYYGTIDATPLWLVLITHYVDVTGDTSLAEEHWPNIEAALNYLKRSTPNDFLYYGSRGEAGRQAALTNQAWKDSGDSVMHKDGKLATAPIAICEVQGYLYDAYIGSAALANRLGKQELETELNARAEKLKTHFDKSFWLANENYVALALDATSEPCDVVASNPGHLLNSGIIDSKQAGAIADRLMKNDMFSGWGIRTLSSREKRYDPKSYHNGSVWPHDNALIVEGMSKRGHQEQTGKVISALFDVAAASSDKRLPELFCGFERKDEPTPVPYNVSCVPQLWCVGSVFEMVKSMTGLSVTAGKIRVDQPRLPTGVNELTMTFPARSGQVAQEVKINRDDKGIVKAKVKDWVRTVQPAATAK